MPIYWTALGICSRTCSMHWARDPITMRTSRTRIIGIMANKYGQFDQVTHQTFVAQINDNAVEVGNGNNGQLVENAVPNVANNQGGVGNFNLDWGRGGEELTWEKLIGLDGSLFFLEHVFWIVSLNTLFILVFGNWLSFLFIISRLLFRSAFCPYHIGHFTIVGFKLTRLISWTKIEGVVTTMIGYVIIALGLLVLHRMLRYVKVKCLEKFVLFSY